MAYSKYGLSLIDIANNAAQSSVFKYATTDTIATVEGANYFAFNAEDANDLGNLLKAYDFMFVGASDDSDIYYITSTGPIVISKIGSQSSDIDLDQNKVLVGNASNKAVGVAMSGDATIVSSGALTIANAAVTLAKINPNSIDGTIVANQSAGQFAGAIPIIYRLATEAGSTNYANFVMTQKVKIIEVSVHSVGSGGGADYIQVNNGSDAITDQMSFGGAANSVKRASTINDTYATLDVSDTLQVAAVDSGGGTLPACVTWVFAVRSA